MSQVELSNLTCITNSSVHVLVIAYISVTHTCHKLNDLALSHRSLIRFLVNVLVFGPAHLIYHKAQPSTIFGSQYSSCVYAVHININAADTVMHLTCVT